MFGTRIEDEQIPDRMFLLDQRIESVQFKTWQVLKDGSYDMGSSSPPRSQRIILPPRDDLLEDVSRLILCLLTATVEERVLGLLKMKWAKGVSITC
jgi:hypothetical protein